MSEQTIAILYLVSVTLVFSYCAGRFTDESFGSDNWYIMLRKGFMKLCAIILFCAVAIGSLMLALWSLQVLTA